MRKGLLISLSVAAALSVAGVTTVAAANTFESASVVQAASLGDVYVFADQADVYDTPNGNIVRQLPSGSGWQYSETQTDSSDTHWYRVAPNQWISDKQAVTGINPGTVRNESGVVVVKTASASVWSTPNMHKSGRTLPNGSSWRYSRTFSDKFGMTWYRVSPTEWVHTDEVAKQNPISENWVTPLQAGRGHFSSDQVFGAPRANGPHDGLDFGSVDWHGYGSNGGQIHAAHEGTVLVAGSLGSGYEALGNAVIIIQSSDGYNVIYQEFGANSKDISVKVGQHVNAGDVIGFFDVGNWNGVATITHLHLGVTQKDWQTAISHSFNLNYWINPASVLHI
jgi:murein DD-endopeptidase MepM/ murein hydrolase activator NlpD